MNHCIHKALIWTGPDKLKELLCPSAAHRVSQRNICRDVSFNPLMLNSPVWWYLSLICCIRAKHTGATVPNKKHYKALSRSVCVTSDLRRKLNVRMTAGPSSQRKIGLRLDIKTALKDKHLKSNQWNVTRQRKTPLFFTWTFFLRLLNILDLI